MPSLALFRKRAALTSRDALASAIAAIIAWLLSNWLFDHPRPVFAAVSAIVCLAPGLPSHGRQAVGLMLGVAVGIGLGELVLYLVPLQEGSWDTGISLTRLGLAIFLSIFIAALFGQPPVVAIQSGVSAVLVVAMGAANAGWPRLEDVAVGAAIGLFFSQILLTPNPIRDIDTAATAFLVKVRNALRESADAMEKYDPSIASKALSSISNAHDSLVSLNNSIAAARYSSRWSLRGRLVAEDVAVSVAKYDKQAIRLYASTLLLAEAVANAISKEASSPSDEMIKNVRATSEQCARLLSGGGLAEAVSYEQDQPTPRGWTYVASHLREVRWNLDQMSRLTSKH